MLFFALEWWNGIQQGERSDPSDAYEAHLRAIEAALPASLVELERSGGLHDARVLSWMLNVDSRELEVELMTHQSSGSRAKVTLHYGGLREMKSIACPDLGLAGPGGYGDLGYTEAHLIDAKPEHWILFSSGIELRVAFDSFHLATEPLAGE